MHYTAAKYYFRLTVIMLGVLLFSSVVVLALGGQDDVPPLAWLSYRDGNLDIYVWNSRTGEVVNVSQNLGYDGSSAWSNDGQLVWVPYDEAGNGDIYVWDSNTGEVINVSQSPSNDGFPTWSNDGQLAWASNLGGGDIYVWNSRTGEVINISQSPADNQAPRWIAGW